MRPRLKLGLVGAGVISERSHIPAIRAVPEVVPWMVADADGERARKIAEVSPFAHWTENYEDLIGKVDLAIVALPNMLHEPVSCRLLESGIHVLCEKPLARNRDECGRMLAAAEAGKALLAVGHNRRLRPNVVQARRFLAKGFIGRITHVHAEEGSAADWPRSKAYFDPVQSGGGALMDVGVHALDLIRYLVGEFTQVSYQGNGTESRVESEAKLDFVLDGDVQGTLVCSRNRELRQELVLTGTEGTLTLGLWGQRLSLYRKHGKAFQNFPTLSLAPVHRAMDASFVEQLYQFVTAAQTGGEPVVDGLAGMKAVELVQWAYTGRSPAPVCSAC